MSQPPLNDGTPGLVREAIAEQFAPGTRQSQIQAWHDSKVRRKILHRNIGKLGGRKKAVGGRFE